MFLFAACGARWQLAACVASATVLSAASTGLAQQGSDTPTGGVAFIDDWVDTPTEDAFVVQQAEEQLTSYDVGYDSGYACATGCDACGVPICDCECACPPKRKCHGFAFGEFLYLRPTGGDVTHAQQQDGVGGAGTVPFGRIGSVSQDFEPGFRVGIGYALDECASVSGSYTFFESSNRDFVEPPTIPGGGGAVRSLVHHPNSTITASTGPVDASQSIDFQMADVMFNDSLLGCDWCSVGYSLGAVYGNLEQEFAQTGVFAGGSAGTIDTDTMIDFNGGGVKAGLNLERHVGHGILFYGKLSAAAMSGRFNADYTLLNSTTDVLLGDAAWEDNRVVSHVEYEVGVRLRSPNGRLRVSAGYQFQHWGNVVTTSDWIDAVQADNYTDLGDTLSFDGLTTRVEARW